MGRCVECFKGMSNEYFDYLRTLSRAERQVIFAATAAHANDEKIAARPKFEYINIEGEAELMRLNAEEEDEEQP
jgi:hypothetical protein